MSSSLAEAVNDLAREAERIHQQLRRRTWWVALVIVVVVLTATAGHLLNRYLINESNRKWCATLTVLTREEPPPSAPERSRVAFAELRKLTDEFGCEVSKE